MRDKDKRNSDPKPPTRRSRAQIDGPPNLPAESEADMVRSIQTNKQCNGNKDSELPSIGKDREGIVVTYNVWRTVEESII